MEEHSIQSRFHREMRLNDFIVLLQFYPTGLIDGSFTVNSDQGQTVYEIQNGIYINTEKKTIFSFRVEWWIINKNSASTIFNGYFIEGQNDSEFNVDWLMIINSGAETNNYTKKGEFSCIKNNTAFKNDPVPSSNIKIVRLLT